MANTKSIAFAVAATLAALAPPAAEAAQPVESILEYLDRNRAARADDPKVLLIATRRCAGLFTAWPTLPRATEAKIEFSAIALKVRINLLGTTDGAVEITRQGIDAYTRLYKNLGSTSPIVISDIVTCGTLLEGTDASYLTKTTR